MNEPLSDIEQRLVSEFAIRSNEVKQTGARMQKVDAIAQLVLEGFKDLYTLAQSMPCRKSAFRQIRRRNRNPKNRIKLNQAIALYQFRSAQRKMQMFMILSQPIEKYKPGSPGGPAIVGESGPEIILNPNYINDHR